jgi:hypothetical protein
MRCGRGTCIWQGGLHKFLGRIEILAALLAATIHDFEHRGFNNDFLIKTQDDWVSLLPSLVLLCLSRHKTTGCVSLLPAFYRARLQTPAFQTDENRDKCASRAPHARRARKEAKLRGLMMMACETRWRSLAAMCACDA